MSIFVYSVFIHHSSEILYTKTSNKIYLRWHLYNSMKIIKNPINNTFYLKETVKVTVSRENFLEKFKKNDVESFKDVLDHT